MKKFDLSFIIFNDVMSFIRPWEQKARLPFSNSIYGILTAQGVEPLAETEMKVLNTYRVDHKFLKGKHVRDVFLVNPLNIHALVPNEEEDNTPLGKDKNLVASINATIHDLLVAQIDWSTTGKS